MRPDHEGLPVSALLAGQHGDLAALSGRSFTCREDRTVNQAVSSSSKHSWLSSLTRSVQLPSAGHSHREAGLRPLQV